MLFIRNYSANSDLNDTSLFALNVLFFFICRNSSWERDCAVVNSSLDREEVVCVLFEFMLFMFADLVFFCRDWGRDLIFQCRKILRYCVYSILWLVVELDSGRGVCVLGVDYVGNKWCVNVVPVCSTRFIDLGFEKDCIIDYLVNGCACMIFLVFFLLIGNIFLTFLLGTWDRDQLRKELWSDVLLVRISWCRFEYLELGQDRFVLGTYSVGWSGSLLLWYRWFG